MFKSTCCFYLMITLTSDPNLVSFSNNERGLHTCSGFVCSLTMDTPGVLENDRLLENVDLNSAAEEESNTRMYDMATWRMYNRIVDHRKHQYFTSHHSTEESVRTDQMGYPISQSMLVSELSSDCLPDEVFELEM